MNKSMVAGAALVAGIAIASPMLAWSAPEDEPRIAQADRPGMGQDEDSDMRPGEGGSWNRDRRGMMGHHHGERHGMRHGMMQLSPQQRCEERLARRAGMIAYTVA